MSSIFGLRSSYMLEYCWLFTLLLRSARYFKWHWGEVDSAPTYLATIFSLLPPLFSYTSTLLASFFKEFIYLFIYLEIGERREKERKRNINVWFPLMHPPPGTWPATQACALTGNWTSDPLVHRPALNPLSHTSQGWLSFCTSNTSSSFPSLAPALS